jgi:hypothetical protein
LGQGRFVSQDGVGKDDELAHDGGDADLGGLSGFDELFDKALDCLCLTCKRRAPAHKGTLEGEPDGLAKIENWGPSYPKGGVLLLFIVRYSHQCEF